MEAFFLGPDGVAAYWLRRGADGWRLDVTADNSDAFWRKFRRCVDSVRPDVYTISELWSDSSHYLLGDLFSATMNYRFAYAVWGFCLNDRLTPSELDDRLRVLRDDTPAPALLAQMNLLDSHDTARIRCVAGGDLTRVRQAAAFQFAYPGAPCVYYGSETGLDGSSPEDGRRTMPWGALDEALVADYRAMLMARAGLPALCTGNYETVLIDDTVRLFGFARRLGRQTVLALFNGGDAPAHATVPLRDDDPDAYICALTGAAAARTGNTLTADLPPRGALWLAGGTVR
jgi:glycosidase